jgi:hypothetical protein
MERRVDSEFVIENRGVPRRRPHSTGSMLLNGKKG